MHNLKSLVTARAFWLRALFFVCIAYLIIFGINLIILALWCGINMQTYPTDGTFQIYNPLRRLMDGQTAGHDFPFFHGVGVPFLHVPMFYILGENVFAAETTKWLLSPLLFLLTSWVFLYAFFRDRTKTLLSLAILTCVASLWMWGVFYPSNSLISIRTTFPMLVAAALLWQTKRSLTIPYVTKIPLNIAIDIPLLGLSFACGTEQGIAAIMAFLGIRIYQHIKQTETKQIAIGKWLVEAISIGFFSVLILFILTKGHVSEALHYALVDVPSDQGWYFGGPPNLYLDWGNILTGLLYEDMLPLTLIILAGVGAVYLLVKSRLRSDTYPAIIFLIAYGVIVFGASSTGYFLPSAHLVPLERGLAMITAAVLVMWLFEKKWQKITVLKHNKFVIAATIFLIAFISFNAAWSTYRTVQLNPGEVIQKSREARNADDTFPLSGEWSKAVNEIMPAIPEGATIWSTYTGVFDSLRNQVNPSKGGEDYIIHALGDKRRAAYTQQFTTDKPDHVITMRPSFFIYEEWLWNQNWDFYRHLFQHYSIVKISDMHVLWKYAPSMQPTQETPRFATQSGEKWQLPSNDTAKPKLYEVTIAYDASANLGIKQIDRIPRYLVDTDDGDITVCPVSLPPSKKIYTFPFIVAGNTTHPSVQANAKGILPFSSLNVSSMTYKEIPIPEETRDLFVDNTILTDDMKTLKKDCNQH